MSVLRPAVLFRPIPTGPLRVDTSRWYGVLAGLGIGVLIGAAECAAIWWFVMSSTGAL